MYGTASFEFLIKFSESLRHQLLRRRFVLLVPSLLVKGTQCNEDNAERGFVSHVLECHIDGTGFPATLAVVKKATDNVASPGAAAEGTTKASTTLSLTVLILNQ